MVCIIFFFFQAEDGIRDYKVTGVQTCALPISAGDQIWFYVLRGRIHCLDRFPKLARYRDIVSARVHEKETVMVLIGRFLPGLRTAIPIACAYANVLPLKFSTLNLISAFAWAGSIMLFVKLGSSTLIAFGLNAWWGPLIPALFVIVFFRWLSLPKNKHADRAS